MNSYNTLHSEESGIIILLMHFTHSLVLTQEQFNRVIVAIREGLIPVPQQRPPLITKNPVEDMDDLLFESKFRFSKPELEQLVALMDLPERIVQPFTIFLHNI